VPSLLYALTLKNVIFWILHPILGFSERS